MQLKSSHAFNNSCDWKIFVVSFSFISHFIEEIKKHNDARGYVTQKINQIANGPIPISAKTEEKIRTKSRICIPNTKASIGETMSIKPIGCGF